MNEHWRPIPEWEGLYEASDQGRVKSLARLVTPYGGRTGLRRERVLKATPGTDGHLCVTLKGRGRNYPTGVHRLVLMAFVGLPPDGMECCHNDGDPTNNRLSNLRWDTRRSNVHDTLAHGQNYWASRTACAKGHPYTVENTLVTAQGYRRCRTCVRAWAREERARARQMELAS